MTQSAPDVQALERQFDMPMNAAGIDTSSITHQRSQHHGLSHRSALDQNEKKKYGIFKGTWTKINPALDDQALLAAVGANFNVKVTPPRDAEGNQHEQWRLWQRDDTGESLGMFGNGRIPMQPVDALRLFRHSCEMSEKEVKPEVICWVPGKGCNRLIIAAQIEVENKRDREVGDATHHWSMFEINYSSVSSMRTYLYSNELICLNGWVENVKSDTLHLTHQKERGLIDIKSRIDEVMKAHKQYENMTNRLINTPISDDLARFIIRDFYNDLEGIDNLKAQSKRKLVQQLENTFFHNLKGGEMASRKGTGFGLLSAKTQITSTYSVTNDDNRNNRRFTQILNGRVASENRRFEQHIREVASAHSF